MHHCSSMAVSSSVASIPRVVPRSLESRPLPTSHAFWAVGWGSPIVSSSGYQLWIISDCRFKCKHCRGDAKVVRGQTEDFILNVHIDPSNCVKLHNLEWCPCFVHIVQSHRNIRVCVCLMFLLVFVLNCKPCHVYFNIDVYIRLVSCKASLCRC